MAINLGWPRREVYNAAEPYHWYLQWGAAVFIGAIALDGPGATTGSASGTAPACCPSTRPSARSRAPRRSPSARPDLLR